MWRPNKDLRGFGLYTLAIALAALVLIGYFSYRTAVNLQQAFGEADRVRRLLSLNTQILDSVRDAETGQRGYLLTGREEYLEPYYSALQSLPSEMSQLAPLLSGRDNHLHRDNELRSLIDQKLRELKETIDLRRSGALSEATAIISNDEGKRLMERIRHVSQDIQVEESANLAARLDTRQRHARQTRLISLLGSALLAFLVGGAFCLLRMGDTQRESISVALAAAKQLLQTTLYSIGDGVITTDSQANVTLMNPVACQLTGWPQSEARGKPVHDVFQIVNEFTGAEAENPVHKVIKHGMNASLANHTLLVSKDGRRIPIDDSGAPIRHEGRAVGAVLVFRDITDRRRAEKEAAYLAALVESSEDAIVGKSTDGVIQSWNAGAERIYGYRAAEIIGHPFTELTPGDRQHEESDILETLRQGRRIDHFETIRLRKVGEPIDVSLTISPIRDKGGRIIGISHLARDITEQKRTAEKVRQAQKLESLGVLAGGIAHDFNNLLTGILGNASLALDEVQAGSAVQDRIRDVIASSERAAQLTRQMLAYSGKGQFLIERIDLSAWIQETVALIRASVPSTVELRFHIGEQLPAIEADPAQLQQLVMNVIINAAEAIPEGRPGTVTVSTRLEEVDELYARRAPDRSLIGDFKPGPHVLFEVTDTGIGMDEATRARMFDPFFSTKFTGRGLGLAAVLGIVRGHRAAIQLISTPGQGTTFQVLFPAMPPVEPKAPPRQKEATNLSGCGTVLIVDDEEVVRNVARKALEHYGCRVLVAEDGAQGVQIFRREMTRLSCVVLDLTMPAMSGEQALKQMRSLRPDIPIILSSGYSEMEAVQRFGGRGMSAFLQKPYQAAALAEKVSNVVCRSARTRPTDKP